MHLSLTVANYTSAASGFQMLNGAHVVLDGLCHPPTFNLLPLSLRLLVFVLPGGSALLGGNRCRRVAGNSGSSLGSHFVSFCANVKVAGESCWSVSLSVTFEFQTSMQLVERRGKLWFAS